MFNKFIFIINAPRGGGINIKIKKIQNNSKIFIWPYEFFISIYLMKSQIIKKRKKLEN